MQAKLIDGDITIDANSDIRRTCNLTLYVKSKKLLIDSRMLIWLNKFIRVYIGIQHIRSKEIVWYRCGTYLFTNTSYQYDMTTNSLNLSCADLMSLTTGLRNGYLSGQSFIIPQGSYIRDVLVSAITQLTPFNKYIVQDIGKEIPYDIKLSVGSTVSQLINSPRDLYPAWESFIDIDETFIIQEIPTLESDDVVLDEKTMDSLVISENTTNDFTEIKNVMEVWGKCLTADWFSESSTYTNNIYNITIDSFALTSNTTIAFNVRVVNNDSPSIKINSESVYPIVDDEGNKISANVLRDETYYVFKYKSESFLLLGQFQIYAEVKDENPDSPFNIFDNTEIRQVLSGGEYDKIYSDDLALQRASYENWKSTRLNDVINLELHAIYWFDVNKKVRYRSIVTGEVNVYIIKRISYSIISGTMSMEMIKFYPLYPNIV